MISDGTIKGKLNGMKSWLPEKILEAHFALRPDMAARYTDHQKTNFKNDVTWILSFLGEAVWAGQPALFEEFSSWLRTFLSSVKVPMKDVAESYNLIGDQMRAVLDADEAELVIAALARGRKKLLETEGTLSIPACETMLDPMAARYLESLLIGDRNTALELVLNAVKQGMKVRDVYLNVFQPVQYEIGRLWQNNRISVAQEHFCTAATQLVMSQLYPYLFTGEKKNKKMITTCVPGELHEMGARMVTDFFEMSGWDTYYLGANMPIAGVIRFIGEIKPKIIAISATMTFHLTAVEEMIRAIRSSPSTPTDMKILVGGYPFRVAPELWRQIGADGFASGAQDAVDIAEKLIAA
ncbi:MAG: cobalamin-binding protein [Alphaproteobacteria bacterium]|nr:cobalamin-binding protein [Alphaproteobacteria bacterium]